MAGGSTQAEADAMIDMLQDLAEKTEAALGRKLRLDHLQIAIAVANAMPAEPQSTRQSRHRRIPLPRDRIGAEPVRTTAGVELAGFNPADVDPKDAKKDLLAAQTLQHALAHRGEYITMPNAVKIMQRTRALLAKNTTK
jgi:hypothetical protein